MAKKAKKKVSFDPDDMPAWLSLFWNKADYAGVLAGINEDDCAILKVGREKVVISVDYLNANPIAMEFGIGTYKNLGEILVAANISDLCGTGAKPIGFLAAIMLNKETATEKDFIRFMNGVKNGLSKHHIPLIGGDTKLGNNNVFCGIAIGIQEKGTKLFLKNSAKVGDEIWVSGNIGSVAAAISCLQAKENDELLQKWACDKIINPKLPLKKSKELAKTRKINAGTDLSDGLGADLHALCSASNVGAVVYANKIPVEKQVEQISFKNGLEPWMYAFTIGGDFQFIVTAKPFAKLDKLGMTKIGHIAAGKKLYLEIDGKLHDFPKQGHRDAKMKNFEQEVFSLLKNLKAGND